jgi:flagellar biogenesis protein FliO
MDAEKPGQLLPLKQYPTRLIGCGAFIIIAGFLFPQLMTGESAVEAPTQAVPSESFSFIASLLRFMFGLLVVVVSIVAVAYWMKKKQPTSKTQSSGPLEILGAIPIPPNASVYLIGFGKKRILAGLDSFGFRSLTPMPDAKDPLPKIEVYHAQLELTRS